MSVVLPDPKDGPPDRLGEITALVARVLRVSREPWAAPMDDNVLAAWIATELLEEFGAALRVVPPEGGPRADPRSLRCATTGNPCGTDTWAIGAPCNCPACQTWLAWFEAVRASGAGTRQEEPE